MKSITFLITSFALVTGCASAKPPVVPEVQDESFANNEAWHPQEDGFQLPDAPAPAKPRTEAPMGPMAPTKAAPVRGQLVNLGVKK